MSRANPLTTHNNAGIAAWRFKLAAEIHSYEDAAEFLGFDRSVPARIGKRLGPHMDVWSTDPSEYIAIKLYDTEIIRYYPNGAFSVDNGGYNTPTTQARLQAVLPEGWQAWHHRKQITLHGRGFQHWPCTHARRFDATTGEEI